MTLAVVVATLGLLILQLAPVARLMRKPLSLLELSVQARLIWVVEVAEEVAVKPEGAAGGFCIHEPLVQVPLAPASQGATPVQPVL